MKKSKNKGSKPWTWCDFLFIVLLESEPFFYECCDFIGWPRIFLQMLCLFVTWTENMCKKCCDFVKWTGISNGIVTYVVQECLDRILGLYWGVDY